MQLPPFLQGLLASVQALPRMVLFAGILVPIFLGTVIVTLATSGGGGDEPEFAVNPTVAPSTDNIDEPATATTAPTLAPTNTPEPTQAPEPPNREDCAAIQGTAYESPEEREWYLANCLGGGQTASGDGGGGGGGGNVSTPSGPAAVGGYEYALGDRMIIPSLGIDASVNGIQMSSGEMPSPAGYFNFLWYDFSPLGGGLGGYGGSGNHVVGCHVDSAVYGIALCWHVRNLSPGATIQYVKSNGEVLNYVVTSANVYSAYTDFSGIVSSGAADLTIITCTGTFGSGSYDSRSVVTAALQ